jgi:alanine-synthesizing transaminase
MFSSRTDWNTTPNRLSSAAAQKRLSGVSITDLTESNPTRCGFSYEESKILHALTEPSILSYNPEPRGLLRARIAVMKYYARRGISLTPEQIILTSSTSEAYSFLFKLFCNIGDEILVPQPSYPLFEYLSQLNDVTLRQYRLAYDGEWHIDFTSLHAQMSERTRAIVIVHPNNPTGSYLKHHELDQLCSIALKHNAVLIADEVFGSFALAPNSSIASTLTSLLPVPLFSLNGISKLLGLPQLKLSWIIVNAAQPYMVEALKRLDIIADTFLSVNTPSQIALDQLFLVSSTVEDQILDRLQTNYRLLQDSFAGTNASVLRIEGGWYAIIQLPQKQSDDEWAESILMHKNILVQPGHFFDIEQKSCIVLSLLPVTDLFKRAVEQVIPFIENTLPPIMT